MADPVSPPERVGQRLEDNGRAWIKLHPQLGGYAVKERDGNTPIVAETEIPRPVIIIEAIDEGRAVKLTPIRNIRLNFIVRANSKTAGGSAESFSAIGGALEIYLDTSNLVQALSGPKIAVMLATRDPGIQYRNYGLVKEGTVSILCKCVAAELTVGGTGVIA